jgi:hypothetical protein
MVFKKKSEVRSKATFHVIFLPIYNSFL